MRPLLLPTLLLIAVAAPALAVGPGQKAAPVDQAVVNSEGFLAEHPDLRWRLAGLTAYRAENYEEALTYFRRAARYADKPSQGMVGEMLWQGRGTAVDRPLAYAWMDLAAERRYPTMLLSRERYWAELDETERAKALALGAGIYAEYGDDVAKPRLEAKLRIGRRSVTGSRTGAVGSLSIEIPTPAGNRVVDGSQYYHDKYWEPSTYWTWQDGDWREPPKGRVDIGTLQTSPSAPAPEPAPEAKDEAQDETE